MTYWKFAPGEQANNWSTQRDSNYVGIGWHELGNVINSTIENYDEIRARVAVEKKAVAWDGHRNVWKFIHDLKKGDVVILNRGKHRIVGIGIVESDAFYVSNDENFRYPTRRTVKWVFIDNNGFYLKEGEFPIQTLCMVTNTAIIKLADELSSGRAIMSSSVVPMIPDIKAPGSNRGKLNLPKNEILFGPPGTGKTFALTQKVLELCRSVWSGSFADSHSEFQRMMQTGEIEFTTFHQNYAYEDFIEGLKASVITHEDGSTAVHYEIEQGILKRITYRALYAWLTGKIPDFQLKSEQTKKVMDYLQNPVQFQVYEGIPPQFVLIIDEINRGNVARIFGELITLVEDTKRATSNPKEDLQPIFVTLPYSKQKFILPPNLHIIGTMNTADRSLIGLDAALRRRFTFVECPPQPTQLRGFIPDVPLELFLTRLNECIETIDSRDHVIGHAYFLNVTGFHDVIHVMRQKIIPQLQEYFFDRSFQLHQLLTVRIGDKEISFVDEKGRLNESAINNRDMYSGDFVEVAI